MASAAAKSANLKRPVRVPLYPRALCFALALSLSSPTSICVITSWYGMTISIPASNAPRRPRKFELRPQARHWRSNKTVAEGDRPSAIVENHSQLEVIAAGLRHFSDPFEVTRIHGGARLDFDTDQCTSPRFNHQLHLLLIFAAVVVKRTA